MGGTYPAAPDDAAALKVPSVWPEGTREEWKGGYATPVEAVAAYRSQAARTSDADRTASDREKTGVFTGLWATNPVNGKQLPLFIADYVLMGYVPARLWLCPPTSA